MIGVYEGQLVHYYLCYIGYLLKIAPFIDDFYLRKIVLCIRFLYVRSLLKIASLCFIDDCFHNLQFISKHCIILYDFHYIASFMFLVVKYRIIPIKRPCPNKRPPMIFSIIPQVAPNKRPPLHLRLGLFALVDPPIMPINH